MLRLWLTVRSECRLNTSFLRGILETIADNGKTLFLGGARFSPDDLRKVSVASMASKVLCDRRNSCAHPLDAVAIRLF